MLFPVRCYTCNAVLAHLHPVYEREAQRGGTPQEFFEVRGIRRFCCRRMFLGHVDLISRQKRYGTVDMQMDDAGMVLHRHVRFERVVRCD